MEGRRFMEFKTKIGVSNGYYHEKKRIKFYSRPIKHKGFFTKKVAGAEADRIAYWRSKHDSPTFIRIMKQQGCV